MSTTEHDAAIKGYLNALPERELPGHLWPRIMETRRSDQAGARRRLGLWGGAAAAAVAIALFAPWRGPQSPASPMELDSLMARARMLEERLVAQSSQVSMLSSGGQANYRLTQAQLATLDQALSEAYSSGAPPETVLELWKQRITLLGELVNVVETGASPI